MNLFKKKRYVTLTASPPEQRTQENSPSVPDGMWVKCPYCKETIYKRDIEGLKICPMCNGHLRLTSRERISFTADEGSFVELFSDITTENILNFPGYTEKIESLSESLDINEAVLTGECTIDGNPAIIGVMDGRFIMGSMGHVVGEKLSRCFELGIEKRLPVIIFTASGGARMQEGIISLMQMAKVSAAAKKHSDAGLLYITVLTDPTTGGVTASFAMLGDIILAEPKALVGFAGRRVIEQTIKQKLPEEFQTAEFLKKHGFIDRIVDRKKMRLALAHILKLHRSRDSYEKTTDISELKIDEFDSSVDEKISPMDAVMIARSVQRPTSLQFINHIFDGFIEFAGDRQFADDRAIVGGIALLNGKPVTVIGTQKGSKIEENIKRNFGQPNPEGYRKALRLMKQAEKFKRPVVNFVNTSGAFCGIGAEERGQGEAIARNLYEMSTLKTPIISVIVGEGGSGGALALSVSDRVWVFRYAAYSILSPEGFASILWKDGSRAREAAEIMKLTAKDLLDLKVCERIIGEVDGGCQENFSYSADQTKNCLIMELEELMKKDSEELLKMRYDRFRKY